VGGPFLANDVWVMHDKVRGAVLREEAALRVLLRVAESAGPQGQHLRAWVGDYARASTAGDWMNQLDHPATLAIIRSLLHEGLFGAVAKAGPQVQRTTVDAMMDVRAGHLDRVALATATAGEGKWSAVFMFGVLTQITTVAIHLGKARASALAVTLFSIGMTISMMIILQFSQPFHGPHAVSLGPIQEALSGAGQPGNIDVLGPNADAPNAAGSRQASRRDDHVRLEQGITHRLVGKRGALLEPRARRRLTPQRLPARIAHRPAQRLVIRVHGLIVG